MSHDQIDTLRRFEHAMNAADAEALLEVVHPDVELHPVTGLRDPSTPYRGAAGVREWLADVRHRLRDFSVSIERLEPHGDRVLMAGTVSASTRTGALPTLRAFWVVRFEDDLIRHGRAFEDESAARAELE